LVRLLILVIDITQMLWYPSYRCQFDCDEIYSGD